MSLSAQEIALLKKLIKIAEKLIKKFSNKEGCEEFISSLRDISITFIEAREKHFAISEIQDRIYRSRMMALSAGGDPDITLLEKVYDEFKNELGKMYSIDQVWEKFLEYARNDKFDLQDIYENLINDLKRFTWWRANFDDDVTIILLKRDKQKEILDNEDEIEEVILKEWLYRNYKKRMKWKTVEEVKEDIKRIQQETAIKNIIKNLENLYRTWEIIKLKQDSIRYIKEWYIHQKINFYLKKAMDNENAFKIKQKNKKLKDKYNLLKELYKKWDYETVIYECTNIISKDWNI